MSDKQRKTEVRAAGDGGTLAAAVGLIARGQVIAAPTDTVYGLVCRYDSQPAMEELYRVKDRPPEKALPVLIGDESQLAQVVAGSLPKLARALIARFWPGPLTLILPALPHLPPVLTAGGSTVGVRIPDQPFLRELARSAGPLASSSANRSSRPECSTAEQVLAQLDGCIPLLVDGGATPLGQASTVLDLSGERPRILREGPLGQTIRGLLE
ncbi:MAG: threonylcarbamoyl-AMP synthase [Caldilineaceae bacterium]|nr:threonylcarbamoyl-AMP synthase [Caldilineaceae bacterium]HRJ41061.1 L-threonylcarbamoyladenylate synthase [Caldilineaceae bacterium]